MYTNVGEIKLIPDVAHVKKGDIKVKLRSRTLNTARHFQPKHSETVRRLHSLLLHTMFEEFVSIMKDDAVLPMIGSLQQHLPSTCCCQSPDCSQLASLSSPITKQSQLNKFFIKSDEIRQEFLMNSSRLLDWVFRNSKMLNQDDNSIEVIKKALGFIETSGEIGNLIKRSLKIYILKWISFSFTEKRRINEIHFGKGSK